MSLLSPTLTQSTPVESTTEASDLLQVAMWNVNGLLTAWRIKEVYNWMKRRAINAMVLTEHHFQRKRVDSNIFPGFQGTFSAINGGS